jgi:hypothetical protein
VGLSISKRKIVYITLDNVFNNTAACEELIKNNKSELLCEGEHLHVKCCAHILNILVQNGMKIIQSAISKIHELLKHIDSSPSRLQTSNGLPLKHGICIDISNRWNATFKMLREVLSYKSILNSYANQNLELFPSQPEWKKVEAICDFLKHLKRSHLQSQLIDDWLLTSSYRCSLHLSCFDRFTLTNY